MEHFNGLQLVKVLPYCNVEVENDNSEVLKLMNGFEDGGLIRDFWVLIIMVGRLI